MDKFVINKQIGKGKYGQILSIFRDNVEFALKIINKSAKHAYSTWKNEIAVMKYLNQCDHPLNVPKLHDYWEDAKKCYILMDIIEGKNMSDLIQETKTISNKQINLAIQTCKKLNRLKIKHCDFKPRNVIWNETKGECFIVDFGCSRITKKPVADHYDIFKLKIKQLYLNSLKQKKV
jgi:serine/threonine protein kinase